MTSPRGIPETGVDYVIADDVDDLVERLAESVERLVGSIAGRAVELAIGDGGAGSVGRRVRDRLQACLQVRSDDGRQDGRDGGTGGVRLRDAADGGDRASALDLALLEAGEDGSVTDLAACGSARHVWVIVVGAGASAMVTEAFAAALAGGDDPAIVRARPTEGRAVWWLDAEAGRSLRKHRRR